MYYIDYTRRKKLAPFVIIFTISTYININTIIGLISLSLELCMVITYSRVCINRVRLPILLVVN